MTSWRCVSCNTTNASQVKRCLHCKRLAGPLRLGDLVDRWLREYDAHRREMRSYGMGKRERKEG